jgi:hypothetical protein
MAGVIKIKLLRNWLGKSRDLKLEGTNFEFKQANKFHENLNQKTQGEKTWNRIKHL